MTIQNKEEAPDKESFPGMSEIEGVEGGWKWLKYFSRTSESTLERELVKRNVQRT